MPRAKKFHSHEAHVNKLASRFIYFAWVLWAIAACAAYLQVKTPHVFSLAQSLESIALNNPVNLLITGGMISLSVILMLTLLSVKAAQNPAMLLYFISTACLVVLALVLPPVFDPTSLMVSLAVFQLLQVWGIAGICTTLTKPSTSFEFISIGSVHAVFASGTILLLFSSALQSWIVEHIYVLTELMTATCVTISIVAYLQSGRITHRHTALIALVHLSALLSLHPITAAYYNYSDDRFGIYVVALITAAESLFLVLIYWKVLESNVFAKRDRAISYAEKHQRLDHLSDLLSRNRHELRSPLSDIIGLTDLIGDSPLDQRQRNFLVEIQHSARKGLAEINRMLSFRPRELTSSLTAQTSFNIETVIQECIEYYTLYIEQRGGEIITDTTELQDSLFNGQPALLQQLLLSIFESIVTSNPTNELLIRLSTDNTKHTCIEFIFSASGINNALDTSSESQLDIADTITRELNGSLKLHSDNSKLTITLPLENAHSTGDRDYIDSLKGFRGLVIDDNVTYCQVMANYFKKMGVVAFQETSVSDAIAQLRLQCKLETPIDFVLADYRMPNTNGIEAIHQIIGDPHIPIQPKCILVSNTLPDHSIDSLRQRGVAHLLEKPVLFNTLHSVLTSLVRKPERSLNNKPLRALLVEDNPITGKIMRALLSDMQIESELCLTGQQSELACQKNTYDIIFLDFNLPDISVEQLLPNLRAYQKACNATPSIVMVSADDSHEISAKCYQLGADLFIAKPVSSQDISRVIELHKTQMS